ncbi:hypothetical protein N7532_003659 [Penicillium argentinense]|uniref:Zn(2)-C6 fungal-type domain-containing protein n=1 Tax=Penicillium argentinense TaxID=1131581 RepID=A0A9W9FNE7_9EURO|nr:uncharacterized protein N7532_003659 [Penicillium argentinense]KAJ5103130.1 hypothetical protein N7532_003659 [Penicillium argentinense]
MAPNAEEPAAAETPPAPSTLPHRQSCDRCHKQKLRCIRESNTGVCDRCLRKRAQCVYSFSLPKGRPTMYRSGGANGTARRGAANASANSRPASPPAESSEPVGSNVDVEDSNMVNGDAVPVANACLDEHPVLTGVMESDPALAHLTWDDMQLDTGWSNQDASQVDKLLTSIDALCNDGTQHGPNPSSPDKLHFSPNHNNLHAYDHPQPHGGIDQNHNGSGRDKIDVGGGLMNLGLGISTPMPSVTLTHLSQLSTNLASLRNASYNMAKAAEASSFHSTNDKRSALIDDSAFDFVSTWLIHGHGFGSVKENPLAHVTSKNQIPYPTPAPEAGGTSRMLREVFCASHRLLEILGQLQVSPVTDPFPSPSMTPPHRPFMGASGQDGVSSVPANGMESSARLDPGQNHGKGTMQAIHHLLLACDVLLLEIYVAVLIVLQHDAGPSAHVPAMGDVRLVLVVQLCSYLIERQLQAVDAYLAPHSPFKLHGGAGLSNPNFNISGIVGNPFDRDRDVLNDLRNQVRRRLTHLRQTLRCSL